MDNFLSSITLDWFFRETVKTLVFSTIGAIPLGLWYYIRARTKVSIALYNVVDSWLLMQPAAAHFDLKVTHRGVLLGENASQLHFVVVNDGQDQIVLPKSSTPLSIDAPKGLSWVFVEVRELEGVESSVTVDANRLNIHWSLLRSGEAIEFRALVNDVGLPNGSPHSERRKGRNPLRFDKLVASERIPSSNRSVVRKRDLKYPGQYNTIGLIKGYAMWAVFYFFLLLVVGLSDEPFAKQGKPAFFRDSGGKTDTLNVMRYKPIDGGRLDAVVVLNKTTDEVEEISGTDLHLYKFAVIDRSIPAVVELVLVMVFVLITLAIFYHLVVRVPRDFGRGLRYERALKKLGNELKFVSAEDQKRRRGSK